MAQIDARIETSRPPFWRNVRVLRVLGQVAFVLAVVLVAREIWLNLQYGVRQQAIDLSWSFLNERAGFDLKEGIPYSPGSSTLRALQVGFMNSVRVAVVGIVLATVIGLIIGIARLSPNWLVRKIAQVWVEALRNTPVLIIIIFVYSGIVLALPIVGAGSIFGVAFISNRGAAFPWIRLSDGAGVWGLTLLVALAAAALVWRWRTAVNERTGAPHRRMLWGAGVFATLATISYAIVGDPLRVDVPELDGLRYNGGTQVSGEYFALLLGLTIYTSSFIAEIVRGSILAVEKGQKEAAEALGFTPFQQLRYVVLPQAMRIAIPPINSQYLNLTKNSSLGLAVAFPDLVSVGSTVINQKGRFTQVLIIWMLSYLALSLTISTVMNIVNRIVAYKGVRR